MSKTPYGEGIYRNSRRIGAKLEEKAADYLRTLGFDIIERNYQCKIGELDLVCTELVKTPHGDVQYLVFVEVKFRRSSATGYAIEAVTYQKQKKLYQCAQVFMKQKGIAFNHPIRFDVVAIDGPEITLVRNAFGGM